MGAFRMSKRRKNMEKKLFKNFGFDQGDEPDEEEGDTELACELNPRAETEDHQEPVSR
jgi:hypothetical protein